MRITDVRVLVVSAPGAWTFVEIETDEGITGVGEGSNVAGTGSLVVADTIRRAAPLLVGEDPTHLDALWHKVYRYHTYLGSRGAPSAAVSAIDVALWDIKAKSAGRPLWDLLGGKHRPGLGLYAGIGMGSPAEELVSNAKAAIEAGFKAVKMDPFSEFGNLGYRSGVLSRRGLREGIERLAAVREAVGPDIEVLIDAHGMYSVPSAIAAANAMEPYDITWMEEPVPPEGVSALRTVRRNTGVPLCVGERLYTRWDFAPILEQGLADYIMPDANWTGGISEMRRIASLAEVYHVPVSPHGANGPLQLVAGATAMITVPNFYRCETGLSSLAGFDEALSHPLDVRDGELFLPDRPGHGFELDRDFVERHRHPEWEG